MSAIRESRLQSRPISGQSLARHRPRGREDHGLDPHHEFAPAHRRRQVDEFAIEIYLLVWRAVPWSQPVEPERRASGEFAHRPEGDQAIEQPPHAAIADHTNTPRRRHGILVEQPIDHRGGALGAQARGDGESFCELRSSSASRSQACAAARA